MRRQNKNSTILPAFLQMLLYKYIAVHIKQSVKQGGSLSKAGISNRVSFFPAAMRDGPVFPFIFQIQNICNNKAQKCIC